MPEAVAVPPSGPEAGEAVAAWEAALEAMELHLDEIRAGLEVGALPSPYEVATPAGAMPACLAARARRLRVAQRDVEEHLRERLAVLSSALTGTFDRGTAAAPAFVDRRG